MTVSNATLMKIGVFGGVATVVMGFLARSKIEDNVKSSPFYKDALKLVRAHPAAVHLLGEPIKAGYIDVGNQRKNKIEGDNAEFEVPLKGSKQKGNLFIFAVKEREGDSEHWSLKRVELEVADRPNKKLVVTQC